MKSDFIIFRGIRYFFKKLSNLGPGCSPFHLCGPNIIRASMDPVEAQVEPCFQTGAGPSTGDWRETKSRARGRYIEGEWSEWVNQNWFDLSPAKPQFFLPLLEKMATFFAPPPSPPLTCFPSPSNRYPVLVRYLIKLNIWYLIKL